MVVGQALCNALMALGGGVRLIILLFVGNRKAKQARGQMFQMFRFNDREARRRHNMAHLRSRRGKEGLVCHRIDAAIPQKVKKKEKKKEIRPHLRVEKWKQQLVGTNLPCEKLIVI